MPDFDIVVVEDNPDDAALTMRALSRHHVTNGVRVFRDGAEALAALSEIAQAKVVLLDLKLPKVSGLDVLRALKSDSRTWAVPVVILTSSQEEPDIAKAYDLGANSYIVKPVDFERFVEAVSNAGMYWLLLNQRRG